MHTLWRLVRIWATQLIADITAPKGWELIAKGLVFLTGLLGLLITFLALVLNLQLEEIKRNEDSYQRFLTDLGSGQERVRVAAISHMPELLARRGLPNPSINPFSVLWRSLGFGQVQINAQVIRSQMKQLLMYGAREGSTLNSAESQAVVDALIRIPPALWFEEPSLERGATGGLGWLWNHPASRVPRSLSDFTRTLFVGAKLQGITITAIDLSHAEFSGLLCVSCRFERVNLTAANFTDAHFEKSFFDYTNLDHAVFVGSELAGVSLYNVFLRGVNFRKARVMDSQFFQPELGPSPHGDVSDLRGAYFRNVTFTECRSVKGASFTLDEFADSRFYGCDLTDADFSNTLLDNAVFDGSSLAHADLSNASARGTSFVNAQLTGTIFKRANLLGADLTGTSGLPDPAHDIPGDGRFINLNIGLVKGLGRTERSLLIQAGAVELTCDQAWDRYKRAGYPYELWLSYRACTK